MFYRCKDCGGNAVYDPKKKKMVCESCGNEETQEKIPQEKLHICNNCGAEIESKKTDLALKCPYCGTYVIFEDRMKEEYKPDLALPFVIDRKEAIEIIRKNFAKKMFIPKDFCSTSSLESLQGRYVPFWMYDMETHVHFEGEADKVRTWDEDDYECTETSTYRILRDFDVDYDKIPVDASKVMPDKMMDLMEPYKYGELGDFDAKYLSGFQAEVYDEDKNTLLPRAKKKADKYSQKYLSSYNVEYDAVRPTVNDKKSTEKESFYSFLPVWRYVYRYQGKNYEFYVNGQTGKAVGEAPTSIGKIIAWFIAVFGSLFFTVEMLLYLLGVL